MTREEAASIIEDRVRVTEYVDSSYVDCVDIEALRIAIKALAQPEQRWIPCSERLPEENGQYLITVKYVHEYDYEDIYSEHGEWVDGKWDMFMFGHCGKVESVTAWMPLPEPWRGEEDENSRSGQKAE